MGRIKVRYLVVKRQKGHPLFYWQPSRALREAGFLPRRVAERTNDIVDAIREAEDLNAGLDRWRCGIEKVAPGPGTLPWLIRMYQQDARFTDLARQSQATYASELRRIEAWSERAGNPPISTITRKHVKAFARSMADVPATAKHTISRLKMLFDFATDEGEFSGDNPARNMRLKSNPPRQQVWDDDQIAAVLAAAEGAGRPSVALATALAHHTGQRQGDVLRMAWSQFDGAKIRLRQSKTKQLLDVPCTRQLLEVLATTPRTGTLMVINDITNRPYLASTFNELFREIARAAGIPDEMQYRDLRRTAVVRLAEAGCSVPEIAAISGHSINRTAAILEVYCPRTSTMAGHAITKLEDYRKRKQEGGPGA